MFAFDLIKYLKTNREQNMMDQFLEWKTDAFRK